MTPYQVRTWPQHLPHQLTTPATNLYFNLFVSATRFPDKAVLFDLHGSLTYSGLLEEVDRLAGYLEQDLGVKAADRVMVYMQNCREFVIAYYAILRLGAVLVPVNPMNKHGELGHYRRDSEARVAFCSAENLGELLTMEEFSELSAVIVTGASAARGRGEDHPQKVHDFAAATAAGRVPNRPVDHDPSQLAVILYSSGTTGSPKGCMHTHRSMMASINTVAHWMGMQSKTVVLAVMPFFHISGMQNMMNTPIYVGGALVLLPRWNRNAAAELMARYGVTHWNTTPTMLIDFLASPQLESHDLSALRRLGGGGAGLPQAVGERAKARLGLDYLESYGLSEGMLFTGNPAAHFKRQCLGVPLFDTDVRIVDTQSLQELPQGEVGEIAISSDKLFEGYWRNEQATREAFIELDGNRFFRSGDLGYVDHEGYFFIVDRIKRMVNASGYKVWPSEIEALLHEHPDVREACVIAANDPYRGETVKAVIVLNDAAEARVHAQDIIDWCKARMAAYKYPRMVDFVEQLPKLATGKVAWRQLQEAERVKERATSATNSRSSP
ncbi:long-chain-fatty-acid--CoA ligase [Variovorax sp. RA8]|uniref:long-chain-fatty-acid--CoA ligase n=1 Tax=Variovorax sp. (strain JCM 16519 / RA8) TaxID=662548 RepID=UPI001316DE4F|nr:long-chain-fatty-acid--CoA ligase [Variovorax sp. RA8]VTU30836.1 Long-chain-fatty-acid--CoA ligase [Variovorax sp. RA8]